MKLNARQMVNKLLEYGMNPDVPPAGSPEDPWRQSTSPVHFPKGSFTGQRPGDPVPPPEIEDDDVLNPEDLVDGPLPPKPMAKPLPPPPSQGNPRFSWRPPTEI